jgi:hypothetical protein
MFNYQVSLVSLHLFVKFVQIAFLMLKFAPRINKLISENYLKKKYNEKLIINIFKLKSVVIK